MRRKQFHFWGAKHNIQQSALHACMTINKVLSINIRGGRGGASVSESASTTSGASAPDDKTATVQCKPATSLAGNNNALAHREQSHG